MNRYCPQCDNRTEAASCPSCGAKTYTVRPAPSADDPTIGVVLDERYRVDALLGQGGMGAVYRATHLAMDATVAVKMIRAEFASNTEAVKRFHREAFAASRLSHPHTIRVFDFGQAPSGDLYMVMEYLGGRHLGDVVADRGPLSVERALKIARETAQSLAEAHASGFVHRDLKPDNIMLQDMVGKPDFVKVLDFGIAKLVHSDSGESNMTSTGAVIGTPYYMSPEQAQGERSVTGAADVYALGVILFEMLTGARPFEGDTPLAILMGHVNQAAPPLPEDLDIPAGLRDLVAAMMRKEPDERPEIHALLAALDELLGVAPGDGPDRPGRASAVAAAITPAPVPARLDDPGQQDTVSDTPPPQSPALSDDPELPPTTPPSRTRLIWLLLIAGVLLLVALGIGLALRSDGDTPSSPSTLEEPLEPLPGPEASEPGIAPTIDASAPIPDDGEAATTTPDGTEETVPGDVPAPAPEAQEPSPAKASTPRATPVPSKPKAPDAPRGETRRPETTKAAKAAKPPAPSTKPKTSRTSKGASKAARPTGYQRLDLAPLPTDAAPTPKAGAYERLELP